jgi:hypothetical protein
VRKKKNLFSPPSLAEVAKQTFVFPHKKGVLFYIAIYLHNATHFLSCP